MVDAREPILTDQQQGVLTLTLNRPKVLNSFNGEMAQLLLEQLEFARTDEAVRVVVLTGADRAFCAGQDLDEVLEAGDKLDLAQFVRDRYNPIVLALRSIEKPVLASVNGPAAGAGANIALACDIVIASETASFTQAFSKIGLIPDSGGTFFLPRLVGLARATAMMFLSEPIRAKDAEEIGMIAQAVPAGMLEERTKEISSHLATQPTRALGLTKRALNLSLGNNLEEQLRIELELQAEASHTDDFRRGVKAFIEKQDARFVGR